MKKLTLSPRIYQLAMIDVGTLNIIESIFLGDIILSDDSTTDCEYIYALQCQADAILELKVKESLVVYTHRDDLTKGILLRVK